MGSQSRTWLSDFHFFNMDTFVILYIQFLDTLLFYIFWPCIYEGIATHSSILAWRIPWTEESCGLQSLGSQRVGHDWSDLAHVHVKVRLLCNILRIWHMQNVMCPPLQYHTAQFHHLKKVASSTLTSRPKILGKSEHFIIFFSIFVLFQTVI